MGGLCSGAPHLGSSVTNHFQPGPLAAEDVGQNPHLRVRWGFEKMEEKKENSYPICHCAGEQRPQSLEIWTGRKNSGTPAKYANLLREIQKCSRQVKVMIDLIHKGGVARVVATEEKNLNMSKSVTMKHCF